MRTTIQLDDDVSAAIAEWRKARQLGLSEAVNELVRRGLQATAPRVKFVQRTAPVGIRIDLTNVAEALELLEGSEAR